jgi:heat shock protein HtpX
MTTTRSSNIAAGIRTTLLLAGLTGLLVVIGALIGGPNTALLFLFIGLLMNLGTWFFSDKIALTMSRAQPLKEEDLPDGP